MQRAIEGLGQHGMVGTSDERLMNLHDALKLEFQKVQRTYQDSLEKLDALALVVGKVGKGQVLAAKAVVSSICELKNGIEDACMHIWSIIFFARFPDTERLQSLRVTRDS